MVREFLGDELIQQKGEAVFNSLSTLAPNDVYLAGYNPGGQDQHHRRISEDIMREGHDQPGWSKLDESWADNRYGTGTKELISRLGYDYRNLFITNAFFCSSPTESSMPKLATDQKQRYMRMHYKLLSIVRPKYLICQGQSAFRQFREWATEKDSHSRWQDLQWKILECGVSPAKIPSCLSERLIPPEGRVQPRSSMKDSRERNHNSFRASFGPQYFTVFLASTILFN